MYLFIAIIFIAELIIAINIISLILKADKKVLYLNSCVCAFNPLAKTCLEYVRCISTTVAEKVACVIDFVRKKREQIIYKTVIIVAVYSLLFVFRYKKNNYSKLYRLISAIQDIATDFIV